MKKIKVIKGVVSALSTVVVSTPLVAFAKEIPTSAYTPYTYSGGKMDIQTVMNSMMGGILQAFFTPVQMIYDFEHMLHEKLVAQDLIGTWADNITNAGKSMYQTALANPNFLYLIAVPILFYLIMALHKGHVASAITKVGIAFLSAVCFFSFAPTVVKDMSQGLQGMNTEIIQKCLPQLTDNQGNSIATNLDGDADKDLLLVQPFNAVNFDSPEQAQKYSQTLLEHHDPEVGKGDLAKYCGEHGSESWNDDHINAFKGGGCPFGERFFTVIGANLNAFFYGCVLIGFTLGAFALEVLVLLLLFLAVFACLLMFFPPFENALFNLCKELFGALLMATFLSAGATLFLLLDGLITSTFASLGITNYFFLVLLKLIVYVILFKQRHKFGKIFEMSAFSKDFNKHINQARRTAKRTVRQTVKGAKWTGRRAPVQVARAGVGLMKDRLSPFAHQSRKQERLGRPSVDTDKLQYSTAPQKKANGARLNLKPQVPASEQRKTQLEKLKQKDEKKVAQLSNKKLNPLQERRIKQDPVYRERMKAKEATQKEKLKKHEQRLAKNPLVQETKARQKSQYQLKERLMKKQDARKQERYPRLPQAQAKEARIQRHLTQVKAKNRLERKQDE